MIASWHVPIVKLALLQELVKVHNLRFKGNPIESGDRAYVVISSEHLPPGGANAFFADWNRHNMPIVEVTAPAWRRVFRQVKGRILAALPT